MDPTTAHARIVKRLGATPAEAEILQAYLETVNRYDYLVTMGTLPWLAKTDPGEFERLALKANMLLAQLPAPLRAAVIDLKSEG